MRSSRGVIGVVVALLLLCLAGQGTCRAQDAPTAEVQRSQELIQEERAFRERMGGERRRYVEHIVVKGVELPPEELEAILEPFQDAWVTTGDIDRLIELIREAAIRHGYKKYRFGASYKMDEGTLLLTIEMEKASE